VPPGFDKRPRHVESVRVIAEQCKTHKRFSERRGLTPPWTIRRAKPGGSPGVISS
jgi:hypothetical protein